jgi:hypothetical protein
LAQNAPLTETVVRAAFEVNPHGAGVAWREGGKVRWDKGYYNLDTLLNVIRDLPLPYVLHCRIPTCGNGSSELCHPFPVAADTSLDLEGETGGYVLFHNGHWKEWKSFVLDTARRVLGKISLPEGSWSDSRGLAWCTAVYGLGFLEVIDEKVLVFGPENIHIFKPTTWEPLKADKSILASNLIWKRPQSQVLLPASALMALAEKPGGASPPHSFPSIGGYSQEDGRHNRNEAIQAVCPTVHGPVAERPEVLSWIRWLSGNKQ